MTSGRLKPLFCYLQADPGWGRLIKYVCNGFTFSKFHNSALVSVFATQMALPGFFSYRLMPREGFEPTPVELHQPVTFEGQYTDWAAVPSGCSLSNIEMSFDFPQPTSEQVPNWVLQTLSILIYYLSRKNHEFAISFGSFFESNCTNHSNPSCQTISLITASYVGNRVKKDENH